MAELIRKFYKFFLDVPKKFMYNSHVIKIIGGFPG